MCETKQRAAGWEASCFHLAGFREHLFYRSAQGHPNERARLTFCFSPIAKRGYKIPQANSEKRLLEWQSANLRKKEYQHSISDSNCPHESYGGGSWNLSQLTLNERRDKPWVGCQSITGRLKTNNRAVSKTDSEKQFWFKRWDPNASSRFPFERSVRDSSVLSPHWVFIMNV